MAILSTVSTSGTTSALRADAEHPVALTHGFNCAFIVAGIFCAAGAAMTLLLLPRQKRTVENEQVQTTTLSFTVAPAAPPVATSPLS